MTAVETLARSAARPRADSPDRQSRGCSPSPSHWASRPPATPGAAAPRSPRATLRGVTTSRSSPCRSTVRRSGTSVSPSRIDHRDRRARRQPQLADLDAVHPRAGGDGDLQQVGGDPFEGRRLDVEAARLATRRATRSQRGHQRQRRAGEQGVDRRPSRRRCRRAARRPSTPSASGMVVEHDRYGAAQPGPGDERQLAPAASGATTALTSTDSGRATKVSISPATTASTTISQVIRLGREQQAEHDEQPDLGQPGEALGEGPGGGAVRQLGVAEHQRGDVHRGEAGGVQRPRRRRTPGTSGRGPRAGRGPTTAARPGASPRRRRTRRAARAAAPTTSS